MKSTATPRLLGATTALLVLATAACSASTPPASTSPATTPAPSSEASAPTVSGEITVLTHRTDLQEDGTLDGYVAEFNKIYPDIKVTMEAISDYDNEVRTRMNTADYGDVLGVPWMVTPDQLSQFFEPLGSVDELAKQYRWVANKSFGDQAYGLATFGTAQGVVINKRVWDAAGVTAPPTSPEEFVAAMKQIKAHDAKVTPVYTNYKDGWPIGSLENFKGTITADPDITTTLTGTDAPWTQGQDYYVLDSLLYDLVKEGLTEADPTSTSWELSKTLIGSGEVAAMFLGSWATGQMATAAEEAGMSRDDISFYPYPHQVDGKFYAVTSPDFTLAINKNSTNKEAARAWIDWYLADSGYAESQDGISTLIDAPMPAALTAFADTGVQFLALNPPKEGQETLFTDIIAAGEFDWNKLRQDVIDAARTGSTSKEKLFDGFNTRWADARAKVG